MAVLASNQYGVELLVVIQLNSILERDVERCHAMGCSESAGSQVRSLTLQRVIGFPRLQVTTQGLVLLIGTCSDISPQTCVLASLTLPTTAMRSREERDCPASDKVPLDKVFSSY